MTQYIKKLPAVFQTVTEKKFFDATFDQVFSKKDSDLLYGYLGHRVPGTYNPVTDFYIPEPTKDRTWWQLEATAFARNPDASKTNLFFYDDLLSRINYYGGNTLNQDRLFESEYYSWAPPIDVDMFTNYQNYYWVDQGLVPISISGVTSADILGKKTFNTNDVPGALPANLTLTTGMKIILTSESSVAYTVENIGGCNTALSGAPSGGIRLVPPLPDFTPGTVLEFLPWDGSTVLATGRTIDNTHWDTLPWVVEQQPQDPDYITIERSSLDRNAWSRTNKWIHIGAINATIAATGTAFPVAATRALRPIIQFTADLTLFKSGTQYRNTVTYGIGNNSLSQPFLLSSFQGQSVTAVNATLGTDFLGGELVCFFNDTTPIGAATVKEYIFQASVSVGIITFTEISAYASPIVEGDILFVTRDAAGQSALRGQTWYISAGVWKEVFNDKITTNQPPLFQLFDHNGIPLDDTNTYPYSNFEGSKIFSYKLNLTPGAFTDPVLKFPIVYTSLGQASDIIFQNNLITDRYTYGTNDLPIDGYYYYTTKNEPTLYNNWNLYQPCPCSIIPAPPANCVDKSKQRVIDRYVVGYGTEYQFKLSATPFGYVFGAGTVQPLADVIVSVNSTELKNQGGGYLFDEINNEIYVDISTYLSSLLTTVQNQPPVVEIHTYTHGLLAPEAKGYFEIPQQLEANPNQLEITEISGSDLAHQFSSIIANQIGEVGVAFGGSNNYRDTLKNRSLGTYILQNVAPLLKTMLVSSSDDLDFIVSERFSQDEYTKFKSKYLKTALQLINQGFNPVQYHSNTVVLSAWVEEILKTVNISNDFSQAFAYSYMIANGSPYVSETKVVPIAGTTVLTNFIDLSDLKNALYIYDTTGQERLLVIGQDYEIVSNQAPIEIQFTANVTPGDTVSVLLYKNPIPAYIPSTPSKLGMYPTFTPRVELDTSYAIPTHVIIGHDGSKTILTGTYNPITKHFSDYRDALLLELETRIYNLIQYRFRNQYRVPIRVESVKSGYFRQTRYSRQEYLDITESYLNKWSAKYIANYRANDWYTSYPGTPTNQLWKLYNYSSANVGITPPIGQPVYYLPGNWKGIFQYYYDTIYPNTRPWEMLGFSEQPTWWVANYGPSVTNTLGEQAWTSTHALMWADIEAGIIREGPSAIYNPVTLLPQVQTMWARPGLSAIIPVDASGDIIPVPTLFGIAIAAPTEPFDHFDDDWKYGDGSPVEQAWMSTSAYAFSVQEFLYLMKPAAFGELLWDTLGTELSSGKIDTTNPMSPLSDTNWQYVQNNIYTSSDPFFTWMRPKNADQLVHAEVVNGITQLRFGYQRWISDRILFLGKDVSSTFGQLVRTLDVNLANKLAGFTNKDTTTTYIESVSPGVSNTNLLIPTTNFEVLLHKSQPIKTYTYSGVIVRALANGTFVVYGYDLLNSEFLVLNRTDAQVIDITIGGTPAEFLYFNVGQTYNQGDIVRYNGVYYVSLVTQLATKFNPADWQKLKALPTVGGVSVMYRPISDTTMVRVPYGSVLNSAQEVFDLLIGWGAYLETQGWSFDQVSPDTNLLSDWLYSAKQFLFWLNTNWAPDASIQLSPSANNAILTVQTGYPSDVETISNGTYSILDKFGVAIPPNGTATSRDGKTIEVTPMDLTSGGIYFLQVHATETEHILVFDNSTNFGDVIYNPLLRVRQARLRFNGFRSNGWYGKMEAPGYLIINNQMVPNYDTIVDAMRYFYDPDVTIDNSSLEDLGRHLIGYESKSYLDNLQVSDDVQYLFYQGAIRQKGTIQSFDKLFRSTKVRGNETIEVFEEWALKLADFGNTVEQVSTEFVLLPEQNSGEVIVARLNFIPSPIGIVKQINIFNAENVYTKVPSLIVALPDAAPIGWITFSALKSYEIGDIVRYDDTNGNPVYYSSNIQQAPGPFNINNWSLVLQTRRAKAYVVLDTRGVISRVDITDSGYGYLSAPDVSIDSGLESHALDRLYSVWQGVISRDPTLDNIIEIDIDDTDLWIVRPSEPAASLEFPVTDVIDYPLPNAGYVNFNDVTWSTFNNAEMSLRWGTTSLNPVENDTIWVAKTFTEDWDVYKMVKVAQPFDVVQDSTGNLLLRTPVGYLITPQLSTTGVTTDFGNLISLQVIEAHAIATTQSSAITATASVLVPRTATATVTGLNNGSISGISFTSNGAGYDFVPTVTISPPTTQGSATATASIAGGAVSTLNLTSGGAGYSLPGPSVTISAPVVVGATATSNISGGGVSSLSIGVAGAGYVTAPAVTINPPANNNASAIAVLSGDTVDHLTPNVLGSGYSIAPSVSIAKPTYTTSTANATVSGGSVVSIVGTAGAGYVGPTTPISIAGPTTSGAVISFTVDSATGTVTGYSIDYAGAGYTGSGISVSVSSPSTSAASISASVSGGSVSCSVSYGGTGYVGPTVPITITGTNTTPATAVGNVSFGVITSVTMTNPGAGYTTASASVAGPSGSAATMTAAATNGVITSINIISGGSGYSISGPNVTISPNGVQATGHGAVSGGVITNFVIDTAGSGYTVNPSVTVNDPTGAQATATAILSGGQITGYTMGNHGSGYTTVPDVTISSAGGVQATAHSVITGGVVTNLIIDNPGSGYTTAPDVSIAIQPTSQAYATANINVTTGAVTGFTFQNHGSGYLTAPTVTIDPPAGSATTAIARATVNTGVITNISIIDPGTGYLTIPTITIQPPAGVNTVQSITITNPGLHYISAPAVHITGDGTNATATATILDTQVATIDVGTHGSGYTTASVTIDPPPSTSLGAITGIEVTQTGSGYTTAPTVTITDGPGPGHGATAIAKISGGIVTEIVVTSPGISYISPVVTIAPPLSVNPVTNYVVGFSFSNSDANYNYYNLVSLDGVPLLESDVPDYLNFTKLMLFKTMRFHTLPGVAPSYLANNDKIWVDNINNKWSVQTLNSSVFTTFRLQEPLIDTQLFESARMYEASTQDELALLPVYDPFKDILPAPAKQNISYMTLSDPARYNVTGDLRLYNKNITFGEAQVGKIWWDLSGVRYVYYEQPAALDGSETSTDNLVYRRDRWGQIFPGSTIDIYEWTKSSVPPADYAGTGTPRSTTDYVQLVTSNKFTNITETNYYFWVKNPTDQPNIQNRTMSGIDISRLLSSPKSQKFAFFAPIQQTSINNSYMFYNTQEILMWQGNNVQIRYRISEREDQPHTQWRFFREGDSGSVVTDQYWNKMVDSLCGYTNVLPVSDEWVGVLVGDGETLAVPDPALSNAEKYGIEYRPRQGMFVDVYAARKIFVQSANSLLQYIPIRDDNAAWNETVTTNVYWNYRNWYKLGFENTIPSVIFATLALAQNALTAGQLANGTIVEVVNGTPDGRFVMYNVAQVNPNVPTQSFELVAIEASAINLLDTIYTTRNIYALSVELRQLLNAFRKEVFINAHVVDQNEMYFSLLNYVVSEQKNPNWVFKTSYIYIKENNLPLTQDTLYIPNQIDNIINYIVDAKPYHTKIRDYTSTYLTTDIAVGTAIDWFKWNIILKFGPQNIGYWDTDYWDMHGWDTNTVATTQYVLNAQNVAQFISQENVYTINLTTPDPGKKGYSSLYPYTFTPDGLFQNPAQTFITPQNIVGIQIGANVLLYGQDYYVEFNNDNTPTSDGTYTVYFYNDPSTGPTPVALIWLFGGSLLNMNVATPREEIANGFATDDLVVNVDTKLPVNDVTGLPIGNGSSVPPPFDVPATVNTYTASPYVGWGDVWEAVTDPVAQILIDAGGTPEIPWDAPLVLNVLPNTISFKENTSVAEGANFYRNSNADSGTLVNAIPAPMTANENLDVITVFVDPITHPITTDILPDPGSTHETVWIEGERLEYRTKTLVAPNTWALGKVRRGTNGTAPLPHNASVTVWVERNNSFGGNNDVWNASDTSPDLLTVDPLNPGEYTSVAAVPLGGLWYAGTTEAVFLKQEQGKSIP